MYLIGLCTRVLWHINSKPLEPPNRRRAVNRLIGNNTLSVFTLIKYTTKQVTNAPLLVTRSVYGKACLIFVSYIQCVPFKQFQYLTDFAEIFRSSYLNLMCG